MMAEQLQKAPKKGILKNSTSFDKNERKSSLKETKWDEMNIIATFHPADKDYGHMKIEEPKTPFNYVCAQEDALDGGVDSDVLAQKIRLGADQLPKAMEQVEEESDEDLESLTEEERETRRKFEAKRKSHYNEFYAVKLARQLMEKDEEEEEEAAEEEGGAGPSSAPDEPSSTSDEPAAPSSS
ncbi:protein phosphatase inhibitor 2-like [Pollicipes pollicipes]|uniref:protein phosphatase inhibitor 2-like n=1 Tax=Pollicipes pollicipes TaxID=41117 RepID=UPI0018853120|nr:protein phosphatase inhibitor 2-like [Pollicipes pollicipes]XP_037091944.1 protein phosphatase inhibitor 2-like [Pollicipes pollicipes]